MVVKTTVALDEDIYDKLKKHCEERMIVVKRLVNKIVKEYLDRVDKDG